MRAKLKSDGGLLVWGPSGYEPGAVARQYLRPTELASVALIGAAKSDSVLRRPPEYLEYATLADRTGIPRKALKSIVTRLKANGHKPVEGPRGAARYRPEWVAPDESRLLAKLARRVATVAPNVASRPVPVAA